MNVTIPYIHTYIGLHATNIGCGAVLHYVLIESTAAFLRRSWSNSIQFRGSGQRVGRMVVTSGYYGFPSDATRGRLTTTGRGRAVTSNVRRRRRRR